MSRIEDVRRFHDLLARLEERLGGAATLAGCHAGRMPPWPRRGVYFFMEPGEVRTDSGSGPRVVRVGTHALRNGSGAMLWTRLRQHRGSSRSGGGNHRASVFRQLVGTALIGSGGPDCPTWDDRSASREARNAERPLEAAVSRTIGGMPCLWLAVEDEPGPSSLRGRIERNAIALLSNFAKPAIDPPSASWLGNRCNREKVRGSGMWNSNHVAERHDPAFLDDFADLVGQAGGSRCSS